MPTHAAGSPPLNLNIDDEARPRVVKLQIGPAVVSFTPEQAVHLGAMLVQYGAVAKDRNDSSSVTAPLSSIIV